MTTNNEINTPIPFSVSNGGSGGGSFTAYSVLCGGTTSTGVLQNVSGVGTSGQALLSSGASSLPTWGNYPSATGYVLQTLTTTTNTRTTTSSLTFVDVSGLSVSITPSASSSKILIFGFVTVGNAITGVTNGCPVQLVRGSTSICQGSGGTGNQYNATLAVMGNNSYNFGSYLFSYLDSPATTSSTTYKLQYAATNSGTAVINGTANNANNNYEGVVTSTIMAMEIHG